MKRWAVVVVTLYILILLALTWPLFFAAFYPRVHARELTEIQSWPQYWIWLAMMAGCQAVMLLVPVDTSIRRPIHRRAIVWPVLASGLMMGLLALGLIGSVFEFIAKKKAVDITIDGKEWRGAVIVCAVWVVWAIVFYRINRGAAAMDVVTKQCRYLLKGSILELLVAVPTHVVARYRDYCCAGFLTFIGIAFGLSVMLFSFGPGVFLLFVQRWKRLHPQLGSQTAKV